jgi:pyruvate/2-oxoglutarate dehydrogenase complex dihydrolipoamide dehydrogenase (E3) component
VTVDQSGVTQPVTASAPAAQTSRALTSTRYDLVVIGGGSAGLSAASLAAALGARVALLDRERLGGECLYTGCVASKALLQVARVASQTRAAARFGLSAHLDPVDLAAVADHVQQVIDEVYQESDSPERYVAQGVDVAFGEVRFLSPSRLALNDQALTAGHFLVCTGSHPTVPSIPGLAEAGFLTNETVFALRSLPARLVVIGGGPVGCELGQAFARLGAHVTILEQLDRMLSRDEPEASQVLQERLAAEGIAVHTRTQVTGVTRSASLKVISVGTPTGPVELAAEEILVATGRSPNVDGLGLEAAGVAYDARQGIAVDATLRTSNPRIYAAGDVIGGYRFTHAAALEARAAVRNALYPGCSKLDERVMPWTTFTEPAVAHVGLTEAQARERHGDAVHAYTQPFRAVDRAATDGDTDGFVKLVSGRDGRLLGAAIVGLHAGEYINELALAMRHGLGLAELAAATHVYPTMALAIQQAAGQYSVGRAARSRLNRLLRRLAR